MNSQTQLSNTQEAPGSQGSRRLDILNPTEPHTFITPAKKIHEGHDVPNFLTSLAYRDIGIFVMQLNISMCPRKVDGTGQIQTWKLDSPIMLSDPVQKLQELLQKIDAIIEEAPPDTGPRRFGNVSFRKWYEILESRVQDLLGEYLPTEVLNFAASSAVGVSALDELTPYLLGGFGSSQRLDYGTGHELSFLAFLGCIWKLGGFTREPSQDGALERSIVIGVIEPQVYSFRFVYMLNLCRYLRVVRRLILTYTLEPAGSHGVWGLDDHSFLPYIFGSSQYCPAITDDEAMPIEGSLPESPKTGDVVKKKVVGHERTLNMYFAAIGFISDVKTGPFWEHSPILFDISGVRSGWGKINKGMIKMYNAEVLSKFPVVQHFPFGSLFRWEQDPSAAPAIQSVHTQSQPPSLSGSSGGAPTARPPPQEGMRAPWASQSTAGAMEPTGALPTKAPWAQPSTTAMGVTGAPWAQSTAGQVSGGVGGMPPMRAPWTDKPNPGGR